MSHTSNIRLSIADVKEMDPATVVNIQEKLREDLIEQKKQVAELDKHCRKLTTQALNLQRSLAEADQCLALRNGTLARVATRLIDLGVLDDLIRREGC